MKKFAGLIAGYVLASDMMAAAAAEDLVAAKNIRAGEIITASAIVSPKDRDAMRRAAGMIGLEATRTFYKGQPLYEDEMRNPTLIKRNAIVKMAFSKGRMSISAEGRALDQGGLGDRVRVMNLTSKRVVVAIVTGTNSVKAQS